MAELALDLRDVAVRQGAFSLGPITLQVPVGCHAMLLGPTGSGKTTLLEVIAGLRRAESGTLRAFGTDIGNLNPGERGIGYVPQDAALFPAMTVRQNLAFGMTIRRVPGAEQAKRVAELAEKLRLMPLLDRPAIGLSGGETQRVALGRAVAFRPKLLLLDEPMSAIDDDTREAIFELLECEVQSALHVAHDRAEADRLGDLTFDFGSNSTPAPFTGNIVRVR